MAQPVPLSIERAPVVGRQDFRDFIAYNISIPPRDIPSRDVTVIYLLSGLKAARELVVESKGLLDGTRVFSPFHKLADDLLDVIDDVDLELHTTGGTSASFIHYGKELVHIGSQARKWHYLLGLAALMILSVTVILALMVILGTFLVPQIIENYGGSYTFIQWLLTGAPYSFPILWKLAVRLKKLLIPQKKVELVQHERVYRATVVITKSLTKYFHFLAADDEELV